MHWFSSLSVAFYKIAEQKPWLYIKNKFTVIFFLQNKFLLAKLQNSGFSNVIA